jgi:hypothetical protein
MTTNSPSRSLSLSLSLSLSFSRRKPDEGGSDDLLGVSEERGVTLHVYYHHFHKKKKGRRNWMIGRRRRRRRRLSQSPPLICKSPSMPNCLSNLRDREYSESSPSFLLSFLHSPPNGAFKHLRTVFFTTLTCATPWKLQIAWQGG